MEDIVESIEPNGSHDFLSPSYNGHFPFISGNIEYFFNCVRTGEKIFPAAPDELETLRIFEDLLLALDAAIVIQITHRSDARSPAHLRFLEHPAHHIFAKIDGELRRHPKLNGHLNHVIGWEVSLLRRDDCFEDSLLEHPLDAATINGVPCQTIQSPTKNRVSFTTLDTQEHFVELLPSWLFCRRFLFERSNDGMTASLGSFHILLMLAGHGEHLLILFILGAFSIVFEGLHSSVGKTAQRGDPECPTSVRRLLSAGSPL